MLTVYNNACAKIIFKRYPPFQKVWMCFFPIVEVDDMTEGRGLQILYLKAVLLRRLCFLAVWSYPELVHLELEKVAQKLRLVESLMVDKC